MARSACRRPPCRAETTNPSCRRERSDTGPDPMRAVAGQDGTTRRARPAPALDGFVASRRAMTTERTRLKVVLLNPYRSAGSRITPP